MIPVEQIEFESDCPDELTQEKNSTFDAYFKINEREDKEWHNETVPVRLICMPSKFVKNNCMKSQHFVQ